MRACVIPTVLIGRYETANCNVPENDYYDKPLRIMLVCTQNASVLKPVVDVDKPLFA